MNNKVDVPIIKIHGILYQIKGDIYMAFRCDKCGKRKIYTSSQKHKKGVAGGKWKHRAPKTLKVNLPNLHHFKGMLDGVKGKWKLCTKCLRRAKKAQEELRKKLEAKKSPKVTKKNSR